MSRILSDNLNMLLAEGKFSAEDLAEMAQCSVSMVYRVRNDDADLSFSKAQALSLALCRHGDTRLARCLVTPAYRICDEAEARTNGCLDDEAAELFTHFGAAIQAFRAGDSAVALSRLADAERALANARAEAARL